MKKEDFGRNLTPFQRTHSDAFYNDRTSDRGPAYR
jgi:hypothetical protein